MTDNDFSKGWNSSATRMAELLDEAMITLGRIGGEARDKEIVIEARTDSTFLALERVAECWADFIRIFSSVESGSAMHKVQHELTSNKLFYSVLIRLEDLNRLLGFAGDSILRANPEKGKPRQPTQEVLEDIELIIDFLATTGSELSSAARKYYKEHIATDEQSPEKEARIQNFEIRFSQEVERLQTHKATIQAQKAAATAEAAAHSSRQAAGEVGSLNLAEHFESYSKSEKRTADFLRIVSVLIVIATVIVLAWLPHEGISLVDILQRALLAIPAFALAGYLAAEAGRHRRTSQWAATLKVQLMTIDAYVQPLAETNATEIRQMLARRAFGELPAISAGREATAEEAPLPIGVQAVLERLLAELKTNPPAK